MSANTENYSLILKELAAARKRVKQLEQAEAVLRTQVGKEAELVDKHGELRDAMKQAIVAINEAAGATEYYSEHPSMKRWMVSILLLKLLR